MSGAAAFWTDDDEGKERDPEMDAELDVSESTACEWCQGPLPDDRYVHCSATCAAAARLDAIGDGS